jgi:hypothetical protein
MTNLFDGVSFVIEKNTPEKDETPASARSRSRA